MVLTVKKFIVLVAMAVALVAGLFGWTVRMATLQTVPQHHTSIIEPAGGWSHLVLPGSTQDVLKGGEQPEYVIVRDGGYTLPIERQMIPWANLIPGLPGYHFVEIKASKH